MYNLSNLNCVEFEILAKDIMQKLLSCRFTRYKVGKDGGIDLKSHKNKIIVQCKHYSNFSSLKKVLNEGKDQVVNMAISGKLDNYYVFTSLKLNPMNRKEIFDIFSSYMTNEQENIIDGTDIDDFLDIKENIDILRKHYKLWLTSTNMIEIIHSRLNSNYICNIHNEIEHYGGMFVDTYKFHEAYNMLVKNRAVLITGGPGVGKSITSLMLISYLINEDSDYEIIHISSNSVDIIIEYLNLSGDQKQLIYMDDFLGRTYLNFDSNKVLPLNRLFKMVENNANLKIIINSRITVLQEVKNSRNYDFNKSINDFFISINVDLSNITKYEKASILYNHLYYKKVPYQYFENINKNKNYFKIIEHAKYNPRIIDYITDEKRYESTNPSEYYKYIIDILDNPYMIWDEEFKGYSDDDLFFCRLLYSLSESYIISSSLENVFNNYLMSSKITPKYSFEDIILRLSNSIINISIYEKQRYISFSNPSILDYFEKTLNVDSFSCISILNSGIYSEQFDRILKFQNFPVETAEKINLFSLKNHSSYKYGMKEEHSQRLKIYRVVHLINKYGIKSEKTKISIIESIQNNRTICTVIELMKNKVIFDFYEINMLFETNYIEYLFSDDIKTNYADEVYDSLRIINDNYDYLSENAKRAFGNLMTKYSDEITALEKIKHENLFDEIVDDIIADNIQQFSVTRQQYENCTFLELDDIDENGKALDILQHELEDAILDKTQSEIQFENLNIHPRLDHVSNDIIESVSYDEKIIKLIEKFEYEDYMADNYKEYYMEQEEENRDIQELFEHYQRD